MILHVYPIPGLTLSIWDACSKLFPSLNVAVDPYRFCCRGILYQEQEKYHDAIASYKRAIQCRPRLTSEWPLTCVAPPLNVPFPMCPISFTVAHLNLGIVYSAVSMKSEAEQVSCPTGFMNYGNYSCIILMSHLCVLRSIGTVLKLTLLGSRTLGSMRTQRSQLCTIWDVY